MEDLDRPAAVGVPPAPALLILTGASHTGKTTVAKAILEMSPAPAAYLGVDDVLESTITKPGGSVWAEIPLAYALLEPQVATLLSRGWLVVLESTFTYVPGDAEPQFHSAELKRMIEIAESQRAPWLLVQLTVADDVAGDRAERGGRLSREIVERTHALHRSAALPEGVRRLDTGRRNAEDLARIVLAELGKHSPGSRRS